MLERLYEELRNLEASMARVVAYDLWDRTEYVSYLEQGIKDVKAKIMALTA